MKAKCRDCEQPIEVWGSKREHLCKQCYVRKMNSNNRGIQYIPIKDLDEREKQKILRRRTKLSKNVEVIVEKEEKTKNKNKYEIDVKKEKEIVRQDMINTYKANKIDYPLKENSLYIIVTALVALVENYETKYNQMRAVSDINDKMSTDYIHAKERYSSEYYDSYESASSEELARLKYNKDLWRRKTRHIL